VSLPVTTRTSLLDLMRSPISAAPVVCAVLAVNVIVFMAMLLAGAGWWHAAQGVPLAWGANFGPATQDGQWWRLGTAMFVHFGVVHLALNMWALWDVGRLMERLMGRWRFAALYLGSGVLGNGVSLVVQGNQAVSGGASGAVFSLYGALLVFLWRERRQVDRPEFRWLFGGALLFTALMLGLGLVLPGIDNSAHAGGLLAGALLGGLLARPWTAQSPPVWGWRWASAVGVLLLVMLLWRTLPAPPYLMGEELKARAGIAQFLQEDQRISQRWGSLLVAGQQGGQSFEQLAGRIDAEVAAGYEHSFDRLAAATPDGDAPSAAALEALQTYAAKRAGAARALSDSLRRGDAQAIQQALRPASAPSAPR
jgi:rhomboid protease GluP